MRNVSHNLLMFPNGLTIVAMLVFTQYSGAGVDYCQLPLDVRGVVAVAVAGPAQRVGQHQVRPLLPARQRPVAQIV